MIDFESIKIEQDKLEKKKKEYIAIFFNKLHLLKCKLSEQGLAEYEELIRKSEQLNIISKFMSPEGYNCRYCKQDNFENVQKLIKGR